MTKLYIAEKASVGKALADVLPGAKERGNNCVKCGNDVVAWASGHLLELFEPEDYDERFKRWGPDTLLCVPEKWRRKEIARTKELLSGIRKLLKDADVVVHGGDADREGQLLIDEILDYFGWKGKTLRLRINDVNPGAIRKALENMKENSKYRGEYMAGQARLYADWLVGLALTRYVTVGLRKAGYKTETVMSVGRVQTPTLGLVVARDREIENFVSAPYYGLTATLALSGDRKVKGHWRPGEVRAAMLDEQGRVIDRAAVYKLAEVLDGCEGTIISVTKKNHKLFPPLPFSLSKLQMAVSRKYDITDALVHAQKLYEWGYITYPRTNCEHVPEGHFKEAGKVIGAIQAACPGLADMLTAADLTRKGPAWNDKKITEHHAVLPTVRVPRDETLSDAERKIYELICARYVLQFLADHEYEETVVEFEAEGDAGKEIFRAAGQVVTNLGWQGWERQKGGGSEAREADGSELTQALPAVRQGETGTIHPAVSEKKTQPPKPYTYHTLLAAMNSIHTYVKDLAVREKLREVQGIGTEATQENIIAVLFKRGYLEKKKKVLASTTLGRTLIDVLSAGKAAVIARPDLTALWERTMTDIEAGNASLESFVAEVAGMVRGILAEELKVPEDIPGMERGTPKAAVMEALCPLSCGGNARRYEGKYGFFWKCGCSPDVTFKDADGVPVVKETRTEALCPVKGCKGKAVHLVSKKDNRPFWKCQKCGNFFDDLDGKPALREKKETLKKQ